MNNQEVLTYLKYLINYSNDLITQNRTTNDDLIMLHKEWVKFQNLIQPVDNIDEKLKNQIMETELDKKLRGKKETESLFHMFLMIQLRVIFKPLYYLVIEKEREKNKEAMFAFRDRLSGVLF